MIVPGPPWQTTTAASRTIASISSWPRYWRCSASFGTADVPVCTKQRATSEPPPSSQPSMKRDMRLNGW